MARFGKTYRTLPGGSGVETRSAFWRHPARWNHAHRALELPGGRRLSYDECNMGVVAESCEFDPGGAYESVDPVNQLRAAWAKWRAQASGNPRFSHDGLALRSKAKIMLSVHEGPTMLLYHGRHAHDLGDQLEALGLALDNTVHFRNQPQGSNDYVDRWLG